MKEEKKFEKVSFTNSFWPCVMGLIVFWPVQVTFFVIMSLLMGDALASEYSGLSYLFALALVLFLVKAYLKRRGIK